MLIILMYHQIHCLQQPKRLEAFEQHLRYLKDQFSIILPGENILDNQISICLTFDDAYYDFYHDIFPLLKKYQVPAVLGIPVNWIAEKTQVPAAKRLSVTYPNGLLTDQQHKMPLCTWEEIRELTQSGLVKPASHSFSHANIAELPIDSEAFQQEIVLSKNILEHYLQQKVDTFIYPYGKFTVQAQEKIHEYYQYAMRIGSSLNDKWSTLLYRIDADKFWKSNQPITWQLLWKLKWKYWINRIRNK